MTTERRLCAVDTCGRPTRNGTADLCERHYRRRLRTGRAHRPSDDYLAWCNTCLRHLPYSGGRVDSCGNCRDAEEVTELLVRV